MKIYVAGYLAQLTAAGHVVTYDWTKDIAAILAEGKSDRDLSWSERRRIALLDLAAVREADTFWLVAHSGSTRGCWVELGAAHQLGKRIIVSGDIDASLFCALAFEAFDTHEKALHLLCNERP